MISYLPIDSQVYSFKKGLSEILIKVDKGLKVISNQVGSWNEHNLTWYKSSLFERWKIVHSYAFRAVTLPDPPIVTVSTNKKEVKIGGLLGEIWHRILEKHMNFSTRIQLSSNSNWGNKDENGTWTGMIVEVYTGSAQLGRFDFVIFKDRLELVNFSPALYEAKIGMFIMYPERSSSWTTFTLLTFFFWYLH